MHQSFTPMLCDLYEVHVVRTTGSAVCDRSNIEGNGRSNSKSILNTSYRKFMTDMSIEFAILIFSDVCNRMFNCSCRKIEQHDTDVSKGTSNTNLQIIQEFGRRP